jgi:hypothetical protein
VKGQYTRARRIIGYTFHPNLWFVEHAHNMAAVAIDDPDGTPDTIDLDSASKDSGWHTPACMGDVRMADGLSWWGWGMYGTDGRYAPLEYATRAQAIECLMGEFPGATLCAERKRPNAASVSRVLRKAGYWIISNQSSVTRDGIRVVQHGRDKFASVSVRLWVDDWSPEREREVRADMNRILAVAGYRVGSFDGDVSVWAW